MKILLGGSFDPVHNGHLRIATELSELMGGQPVHLLPCKEPVHKASVVFSERQRVHSLTVACSDNPFLELDLRELNRSGDSYTVFSLEELRAEGETPVFAMGTDSALSLPTWRRAEEFSSLCHIVVLPRPGEDQGAVKSTLTNLGFAWYDDHQSFLNAVENQSSGCVLMPQVSQLQISSSDIRERLVQKKSIRYLVPDAIVDIICDTSPIRSTSEV